METYLLKKSGIHDQLSGLSDHRQWSSLKSIIRPSVIGTS